MKNKKIKYIPLVLLGLLVASCSNEINAQETPNSKTDTFTPIAGAIWSKAESTDDLMPQSTLLLSYADNLSPATLSNGYFTAKEAKYGRVDTDQELLQLQLIRYTNGTFRLYNKDGEFLAISNNKLNFTAGESYWNIKKYNGGFSIKSAKSNQYLAYEETSNVFSLVEKENELSIYLGKEETFIYPTGLEISGANEVPLNETITLDLTYYPETTTEKEVEWTSSDESTAVVSNDGIVSAKKEGEVTITVNSKYDNSVNAQYNITVNKERVHVTGLSVDYTEYVIYSGEEPTKIKATVLPVDATNKQIHWSSEDVSIVDVNQDGYITAINGGETYVNLTTDDGGYHKSVLVKVFKNRSSAEKWTQVTTYEELDEDREIVIANKDSEVVAGSLASNYLARIAGSTFSTDKSSIEVLDARANHLLAHKVSSNIYQFETFEGEILGAKAVRSLSFSEGETNWEISFDENYNASISSSNKSFGSIQYGSGSRAARFTNYDSEQLPVQIYYNEYFTPIYPSELDIYGDSEVSIGTSVYYSVGFKPNDVNMKKITWSTNHTDIATIDARGKLTALKEGNVQVIASASVEEGVIIAVKEVTIKHIPVSGISLNVSNREISIGKSFTLIPSIEPSNATHKDVTFSSSDPSIASVDSNGVVSAHQLGIAYISAKTEDGGFEATAKIIVVDNKEAEWTIMLYICGADLESGSYLATSDIEEILKVRNQPEEVNIIIETGGAYSWSRKYNINASYLQRWHVANQELVLDESITRASMGSSNTFQSFIEWGLNKYPAEKTGVILWNHGGAMRGVCYDELYNSDSLSNAEVNQAMGNAFNNIGRTEKLEWIGYDACLMAVQDIAEFNSRYFNYMVSSEESEVGYGWDYDTWIDDLFALRPTETILKAIVDGFIAENGSNSDQTLSVMNLKKIQPYFEAWENMADALFNKITTSNRSKFNTLVKKAQYYTYSTSTYGIFDARDFIDKLSADSTFNPGDSYLTAVKNAFNNLMTHNNCGSKAGNSYGVCLYWASSSGCSKGSTYTSSLTNFVNWRKIVTTYGY